MKLIERAKVSGYAITLFFVYLNSVDLAKERVAIRVSKGGHSIPPDVIERRYFKGLKSFSIYSDLVDKWFIYDNSGNNYELVALYEGNNKNIINFEIYTAITGYE